MRRGIGLVNEPVAKPVRFGGAELPQLIELLIEIGVEVECFASNRSVQPLLNACYIVLGVVLVSNLEVFFCC